MTSALYETYIDLAGPEAVSRGDGFIALVDAQTGLGKTYQATQLQLEHLLQDSKRKIVYSTNLRVNVKEAYDELKKQIVSSQTIDQKHKKRLLENVIHIPSQETSITQISDDEWAELYDEIDVQNLIEVRKLRDTIKVMSGLGASLNKESVSEELSLQYSKLFALTQSIFKNKVSREGLILSPSIKSILRKIFPASRLKEDTTQVVFMTTAKLLYPWHAIHKNYRISDILQDALIVLDEFDRQQGEFLNHLLQDSNELDFISIVRRLYSGFQTYKIEGDPEFEGVDECFNTFRRHLKEFNRKWRIDYRPFITNKTIQAGKENQNRIFTMLSDRMSLHAINFKHNELRSNINTAKGSHEIGESGSESAIAYVNSAAKLVRTFCNAMLSAINTLSNSIENNGERQHSTEDMVGKILNHFGLAESKNSVMALLSKRLSFKVQQEHKTYSYHDTGFEIARLSKFDDLDNTAKAYTFDLALTPTGLLANWVLDGAKILGISATASSKTVIHNFDLVYLKSLLNEKFKELSDTQRTAIQQEYYERRQYQQKGIQILASPVSERDMPNGITDLYLEYQNGTIDDLFLEQALCEMLNVDQRKLTFEINRVNKLLSAITKFAKNATNRYQFCMLNKSYKSPQFNDFMRFVGDKFGVVVFENINAASFRNDTFAQVLNTLETTDKKVVVITNYQATGAGLSPSYVISDEHNLNYIGPPGKSAIQNKTDIDSLYLEQPKSLVGSFINPMQPLKELKKAIKKNIHDALMLHEQGVITANDVKPMLSRFIASNVNGSSVGQLIGFYKGTDDYRFAVYRFIEQALGRMCRTEWKQKEINIFYDAQTEFLQTLAADNRDLAYLSEEYKCLIAQVQQEVKAVESKREKLSYSAKASRNHAHIQRLITSVYQAQNKDAIAQYNKLRNYVLQQPTSQEKPEGERYRYYLDVSAMKNCTQQTSVTSYNYKVECEGEGSVTQVFINPPDTSSTYLVSGSSARLDSLMKNEVVHTHFLEKGFATDFGTGNFVMLPAMFDIYMGAIGEEAVFAILDNLLIYQGYSVRQMPEGTVEWFDGYIVIGSMVLLIDVKHWALESTSIFQGDTLKKCGLKLTSLKANTPPEFAGKKLKALYINTFYDGIGNTVFSKFSSDINASLEAATISNADVIDVPGILDSNEGHENTKPLQQLVSALNSLKGIYG